MKVSIQPSCGLSPMSLTERGEVLQRRVTAICANLSRRIGERECLAIQRRTGWEDECFSVEMVRSVSGPGNLVAAEIQFEHVTEVLTSFGQVGRPAEVVGKVLARDIKQYLAAEVLVGKHLADQIMLPMAIGRAKGTGGGVFRTLSLSRHATTQIEIIRKFLGVVIDVRAIAKNDVQIEI